MCIRILYKSDFTKTNSESTYFRDSTTFALFCYLLLQPHYTATRSQLITAFWPEHPDAKARALLSVYLSYLKQGLQRLSEAHPGLDVELERDRTHVRLRFARKPRIDLEEFYRLVEQAEREPSESYKRRRLLERAFRLYTHGRDELLPGLEHEWVLEERQRLRERYADALRLMVEHARAVRDRDLALQSVQAWVRATPYDEAAHRELMLIHWGRGELHQALQVFARYEALCRTEIHVEPSADLKKLYAELKELYERGAVGVEGEREGEAGVGSGSEPKGGLYKQKALCKLLLARAEQYEYEDRVQEQETALEQALQLAEALHARVGEPSLLARVLVRYANLRIHLGRYEEARRAAERALRLHRERGNRQGEIEALIALAECDQYRGRYPEALRTIEEACALAEALGDRRYRSRTLYERAWALSRLGKNQDALHEFQRAWREGQEVLSALERLHLLSGLGGAHTNVGNFNKALNYFMQSLEIARELGLLGEAIVIKLNLAFIYDEICEYYQAKTLYEEAAEVFRKIQHAFGEATALINLNTTLGKLGEHREALRVAERALELCRRIGDAEGEVGLLLNCGVDLWHLGRVDEAEARLWEAQRRSRRLGFSTVEARVLAHLADLYRERSDVERAYRLSRRAVRLLEGEGLDIPGAEGIWFTHFQTAQAAGHPRAAKRALQQAYERVHRELKSISDPTLRAKIMQNKKFYRQIVEAWEALGG